MKQLRVSIAIPAYNEESNIVVLLNTILRQKMVDFKILEVIVISDGSTDHTNVLVAGLSKKYPLIKFIPGKSRLGKVARLNQIYRIFRGDVLCIFDGDIALATDTVAKLVKKLISHQSNVLVAAHQIPLDYTTYISKIIRSAYQVWDDARLSVPYGDHIQNFYGAASAYRGSFARSLTIPKVITDERGYIYLSAKQAGNFVYAYNSPIYYWPVTTLADFLKLGDRSFSKNEEVLSKYFQRNLSQVYYLPPMLKLSSILHNFMIHPVLTILGILLNIYSRAVHVQDRYYASGMWEICTSTKKPIEKKI